MNPSKRIASLFRELAQAFDDLEATNVKKRPRLPRERSDRAAEEAARRVRSGLRKQGIIAS